MWRDILHWINTFDWYKLAVFQFNKKSVQFYKLAGN